MTKATSIAVMWICRVFKVICQKVYDPTTFQHLNWHYFYFVPSWESVPSKFLWLDDPLVHTPSQWMDICMPTQCNWMYPIEQAMKNLKEYMRNLTKPKNNIVKGYIFYEALCLVIDYMSNFGATRRRIWDANEEEAMVGEVL